MVLVKRSRLQSQALMRECRLHAVQFINSSKFLPSCRLHIIDQVRNAELPLCGTCIDLWGQAAPSPIEGE